MRQDDRDVSIRLLELSLQSTKAQTIAQIYKRIKPGEDGRIRTVLSIVGTETGRFSSSDSFLEASTNLQNIPKKTAMLDPLYDVRRCIVPAPGHTLIEVDLSQAEARATSAYACDERTLSIFNTGRDVHKWTASRIFDVDEADVTKEQRHLGKMARHALNYGMGWRLFMNEINKDADLTGIAISAKQAKAIVDAYHEDNEPLLRWWDEVWDQVQSEGYLETQPFGRRRDFLSPYARKTDVVAFLPQSTIADLLNWRLSVAYERYDLLARHMLLQIHDAILFEVPNPYVDEACVAARECLEVPIQINQYTLTIPADVSMSRVAWSEMEEV